MQPTAHTLQKREISKWIEMLSKGATVIAPTAGYGGDAVFSTIASPAQVLWDFGNPLHPPKQFALPQTEPVVAIRRAGRNHELEPIHDDRPRVLFNVRSCDVKGLVFLKRMHEMEPADVAYLRRWDAFTVVSLACSAPQPECFCICTDSGPFLDEGYDIQLTDLGEDLLVEVGTPKGAAALSAAPQLFRAASDAELSKRKTLEMNARNSFGQETCHFASAMRRISTGRVEGSLWAKMSEWCLECGGCNLICPTCYCFSVKDLARDGMWIRCRIWDSCQYAAFTLEASGHNPREQRKERMKRRFFHKVSAQYYLRDGSPGCVGCGRCIKVCLGTTDMPAVVGALRKGEWHG
jgi:ferredoxin